MEVRDIEQLGQMFEGVEVHNVKIRRRTANALSRSAVSLDVSGHSKTSSKGRRRLVASDFGMDVEDFKAQLRVFPDEAGVDSITLCTCQQSRNFPYCDSTHVVFNKETNSNLSPIVIKLTEHTQPILSNCCTQQCQSANETEHQPQVTTKITSGEVDEPTSLPRDDTSCPSNTVTEAPTPPPRKYTPSNIRCPSNKLNVITKEEVAQHRTKDSLWMIINNNVYDITGYIPHHPGGERALLKFGGADGSENVEFHSKSMLELLNKFYFIGKLDTGKEQRTSFCIIS